MTRMRKKAETTPKRPARRTNQPDMKSGKSSGTGKKIVLRAEKSSTDFDDGNSLAEGSNSPINGSSSLVKPININVGVLKKAKEHARQLGIKTLKEYSESALLYFIKNGIDPTQELESGQVSVEVTRLRNQVFSFLQKQEQAYILPIFREVTGQSEGIEKVEKSLEKMVEQLEKVYDLLYRINQMVHVSTSTTLFVSGLPQGQIDDIKEKNRAFVEAQVSEFKQKKQS